MTDISLKPDYVSGLTSPIYPVDDTTAQDIATVDAAGCADETLVRSTHEYVDKHFDPILQINSAIGSCLNTKDISKREAILNEAGVNINTVLPMNDVSTSIVISNSDYEAIRDNDYEDLSASQKATVDTISRGQTGLEDVIANASDFDEIIADTRVQGKKLTYQGRGYIKASDLIDGQDLEDSTDQVARIALASKDKIPCAITSPFTDIDSATNAMSELGQNAEAVKESFRGLVTDFETKAADLAPVAKSFIDNIQTKMLSVSQTALQLLDRSKDVVSDDTLSYKDRVKSLLSITGMTQADNESDVQVLEPYENGFSGITGMNPIEAYGENLVSAFDNIDMSSIGSAISGTCNAIGKFIGRAFNGLGSGVNKLFSKIKESTTSPTDLYVVNKVSDPVIGNMGWSFKLDSALSNYYKDKFSKLEYTIFSLAGSKIYLWVDSDDYVRGVIKFPAAKNESLNNAYGMIKTISDQQATGFDWWTYASTLFSTQSIGIDQWVDPSTDYEAIQNMQDNKRNFIVAGTMLLAHGCSPMLMSRYCSVSSTKAACFNSWKDAFSVKISKLFENIDSEFKYHQAIPSNPSNSDVANEACYFMEHVRAGSTQEISSIITPYDPMGGYIYSDEAFINGLVDLCCRYVKGDWKIQIASGGPIWDLSDFAITKYLPYYHSQSSMDGRYAVKTDSQNAQSYAAFIAAFVITIAAVLIGAKVIKTKVTAKKNVFNLTHDINTTSYHMEEAMQGNPDDMKRFFGMAGITDVDVDDYGVPNNPKQIAKMQKFWRKDLRKKQRKLNRLQKLSGCVPTSNAIDIVQSKISDSGSSEGLGIEAIEQLIAGQV